MDCDYFKTSYIAAYNGSMVLDTIEINENEDVNVKISELYKQHGSDIDIAFNFNGYKRGKDKDNDKEVYKYVGWVNIDELVKLTDHQKQSFAESNTSSNPKILVRK